jgi:hypothetical protein
VGAEGEGEESAQPGVVTAADVVAGHVGLDISCLDRLYLNGYVAKLQTPGGVIYFFHEHWGEPIVSPAYQQLAAILRARIAQVRVARRSTAFGEATSAGAQRRPRHCLAGGRDLARRGPHLHCPPPGHLYQPRNEIVPFPPLPWGPPGDHTVSMPPNNPQVATPSSLAC